MNELTVWVGSKLEKQITKVNMKPANHWPSEVRELSKINKHQKQIKTTM